MYKKLVYTISLKHPIWKPYIAVWKITSFQGSTFSQILTRISRKRHQNMFLYISRVDSNEWSLNTIYLSNSLSSKCNRALILSYKRSLGYFVRSRKRLNTKMAHFSIIKVPLRDLKSSRLSRLTWKSIILCCWAMSVFNTH